MRGASASSKEKSEFPIILRCSIGIQNGSTRTSVPANSSAQVEVDWFTLLVEF